MNNVYAGIGSRAAPEHILDLCKRLALQLAIDGWTLRSGHAYGCDLAFERGANGKAEIFRTGRGHNGHIPVLGRDYTEPSREAFEIARNTHPSWMLLAEYGMRLHARSVHQILGPNLDDPVRFVVCWTPDGATWETSRRTGGSGQALRLAVEYKIPVFNLQRDEDLGWVTGYLEARSDLSAF